MQFECVFDLYSGLQWPVDEQVSVLSSSDDFDDNQPTPEGERLGWCGELNHKFQSGMLSTAGASY